MNENSSVSTSALLRIKPLSSTATITSLCEGNPCVVMGSSSLLIECTKLLLTKGFTIRGIQSEDLQVEQFAKENCIPFISSTTDFISFINQYPFDYLFSIVNKWILPEAVLQLPRKMAINYHDGPLPAYAGVHATLWAILNKEAMHGITWHQIEEGIDTGDIIKQEWITIDEKETSIRLNLKCYQAAIHSFDQLSTQLLTQQVVGKPQNLANRTYFSPYKRPLQGCIISWQQSAEEIMILYSALDFGFHFNPIGLPKICVKNTLFILCKINLIQKVSTALPGTIIASNPEEIQIATSTHIIGVQQVQALDGEEITLAQFIETFDVQVGCLMQEVSSIQAVCIGKMDNVCARYQNYWNKKLASFQPVQLPFARLTHEQADTHEFQLVTISIPLAVQAFFRSYFIEDYRDAVITALLLFLSKISGNTSVGVGFQSEKLEDQLEQTLGFFASTLPVEVIFEPEYQFQHAYEKVVKELYSVDNKLTYPKDLNLRNPAQHANDATLVKDNYSVVITKAQNDSRSIKNSSIALQFMVPTEGVCKIAYHAQVWRKQDVEAVKHHFLSFLQNLINNSSQPIKKVGLLTKQEYNQIVYEWNQTKVSYPEAKLIHELVEEQAITSPDALAIVYGNDSLTYQELNDQSTQVARHLQKCGMGPQMMVGICLERSLEMIVGLLGILKAGGAYVPFDPGYPQERLQMMIEDTQVPYIITLQKWAHVLPVGKERLILLDAQASTISSESANSSSYRYQAKDLAYVLFTSGSTGKPKGVCVPHQAVVRLVKGANYARLNSETIMLGLASLAFDASTFEIWGSLCNGGKLILVSFKHPSLFELTQVIQQQQINTLFLTTALFHLLVEQGMEELTSLRQLLTGGEVLSLQHAKKAIQQLPDCKLSNVYGPTENTTFSSFYPITEHHLQYDSVPIGRPISNTELYVLDPCMQPVPVGIPGELYTGGDGLATGYLNNAVLTQEKFVVNPFENSTTHFLYKTGDLVRYLPDGNIEFIGRSDHQVKIRGFRIELGEIEAAINQYTPVVESVVALYEPTPGDKRLIAYVVGKPGQSINVKELRAYLKAKLPEYMVPASFKELSQFPLTPNGKIDKKKLPQPASAADKTSTNMVDSSTQKTVLSLWKQLLQTERISIHDNFFESGGNSLLAMQLVSRIQTAFGSTLSIKEIFDHPDIYRLSRLIDARQRDVQQPITLAVTVTNKAYFPLSSAQQSLWITHQLIQQPEVYNVPLVIKLCGKLDISLLEKSINEIIKRHQSLRTAFVEIEGQPYQYIKETSPLSIVLFEDLVSEQEAFANIDNLISTPFNLAKDPLLRIQVFGLGADQYILVMVFHHIITDGWSLQILKKELSLIYTDLIHHQPLSLPILPFQYTDYTHWHLQYLESKQIEGQLLYWKQKLEGMLAFLPLPLDKPRPSIQTNNGADYEFTLPASLAEQIREISKESESTVFITLLALFKVLLHKYCQAHDILVGTPVANRSRQELEQVMGYFVNILVVRTEILPGISFREILRCVRQTAIEAYTNQQLPFERLVKEVNPQRNPAYHPLIQVMFDFQNMSGESWNLPGLHIESISIPQKTAKFDLHFSVAENKHELKCIINYNTDLFNPPTIALLAENFLGLAEQAVFTSDIPLSLLKSTFVFDHSETKSTSDTNTRTRALSQSKHAGSQISMIESEIVNNLLNGGSYTWDHSLETRLKDIWCQVLHVKDIALDDNFFESGGHSLLAVKMMAQIHLQLGKHLPVATLFAHPTIREMMLYIQLASDRGSWESLVTMHPNGNKDPIFFVHPVSGEIDYAYKLLPYFDKDQPVYGLQAKGLNGVDMPLFTIEEMANYYVELITSKHPTGPYHLAGYSLGGIIAYEMAMILSNMGKGVGLLAMLDAYPHKPGRFTYLHMPVSAVIYSSINFVLEPTIPLSEKWKILSKEVPFFIGHLLAKYNRLIKKEVPNNTISKTLTAQQNLILIGSKAHSLYKMKSYSGKILFVRAMESSAKYLKGYNFGWKKYARKGVDLYELPYDHNSLFKESSVCKKIVKIMQHHL